MDSGLYITHLTINASDDVIYSFLFSRAITGQSFTDTSVKLRDTDISKGGGKHTPSAKAHDSGRFRGGKNPQSSPTTDKPPTNDQRSADHRPIFILI